MIKDSEIVCRRWPIAEAFYEERDHRTKVQVENFHSYVNIPIEIYVSAQFAGDITIQRMALLATNLTARWARNVRVFAPSVNLAEPLDRHGDQTLSTRILREMREADPFGNFIVQQHTDSFADCYVLRLFIGPPSNSKQLTESDYVIDAIGWSAIAYRGGQNVLLDPRSEATAPTAALAASIGAGDLFKRAIGHPSAQWLQSVNWCIWHHNLNCPHSHSEIPRELDFGKLLIAGIGAVGSALLYILGWMYWSGQVTLLDRDTVEASNLNRSPLFTAVHAAINIAKTMVGKDFLSSLGVESKAVQGTWREQGTTLSERAFDVWVSLTNEDGAWAEVPFQLPPIVLHGTTTSGWGISFGRHIPRRDDCTVCRLPRPHEEFRAPCSEGEVRSVEQVESTDKGAGHVLPVTASLPFLSAASAALVAAELMKLTSPEVMSLPNSVSADFQRGLNAIIAVSYAPTDSCSGCQIAWVPLWKERGGRGRYAKHSVPS